MKQSKPKPLDVLLMVSQTQPPSPVLEIRELARQSQEGDPVYFVTTRTVKGLWPKSSTVSFYADKSLGNAYLGRGTFEDYIPISEPRAQEILSQSPKTEIYRRHGIPSGTRGLIEISSVEMAKPNETIDDLNGIMRIKKSRKRPRLCLANLPNSAAKAQIYYYTADDDSEQNPVE